MSPWQPFTHQIQATKPLQFDWRRWWNWAEIFVSKNPYLTGKSSKTVATVVVRWGTVAIATTAIGREKFVHRKVNLTEQGARVGFGLWHITAVAFFFRQAVVKDRYDQLGVPLKANNGKLSQ